jgi:hypothetical protein
LPGTNVNKLNNQGYFGAVCGAMNHCITGSYFLLEAIGQHFKIVLAPVPSFPHFF